MFGRDYAATLRAHNVSTLDDRVRLIRRLIWWGEAAFDKRVSPNDGGGIHDPRLRELGLEVTRGCRARDDVCELQSIYDFVRRNVRYTGDISMKDTFQSAWRTFQMAGGDCDDHVTANAVLAAVNGFQSKARITSNTGASWDHIYCLVGVPKHAPRKWMILDTTLPGNRFNQQPPFAKHRDFDLDPISR